MTQYDAWFEPLLITTLPAPYATAEDLRPLVIAAVKRFGDSSVRLYLADRYKVGKVSKPTPKQMAEFYFVLDEALRGHGEFPDGIPF